MKKTILLTGSTDGIGKLAAIDLVEKGHHVFVHGRTQSKIDQLIDEIKNKVEHANVDSFCADLSDLDQVKVMAKEVKQRCPRLDVLINNAGVFLSSQRQNKDGWDLRFAVNYLAPRLLTQMLLPVLDESANSRIINLGSAAQSSVSLSALNGTEQIDANSAYAQSKLALTMWSFLLAKNIDYPKVIVVNPGSLLNTKMVQEAYGKFWSSADKGKNIIVDLAISDRYAEITGKYFDNDKGDPFGRFGKAHPDAYIDEKLIALDRCSQDLLSKYLEI